MHTFRFPDLAHILNLDEVILAKSSSPNKKYYNDFIEEVENYNKVVNRTIRRLRPIRAILDDIGRKILSEDIPDITAESLRIYDITLGHIRFLMHNDHSAFCSYPNKEFLICEQATNTRFIIKVSEGYPPRSVADELKKYHDYIKAYPMPTQVPHLHN